VRSFRTTSANMARLSADLDSSTQKLTQRVDGLLARLDRGEGSAGKLLTDTLLYRDVRNLVGRMDSLVADIKKNPKKYINVRIF
jgi:phospholipid/cholesterol/gamma-HCH transport system substrate-binding protein